MSEILTVGAACQLAELVGIVNRGKRVAWVADNGPQYGTVRHFVVSPERFSFPGPDRDIRDTYVRITTRGGFEATLSVREAMSLVAAGEFSEYDWS